MKCSPHRVLLVVSSLAAGGTERTCAALANSLEECGWKIGVLTLSSASTDHYLLHPAVERIAVDLFFDSRSIVSAFKNNLRCIRAIRRSVLNFLPDVVVSFIEQTNVRVLAALLGAKLPTIVSERTDPRRHQVGTIWNWARRLLYPRASCILVQTSSVAVWAQEFISPHRICVMPNFVGALPEPATDSRDANQILAVGRLEKAKGFDVLLSAFAMSRLAKRGAYLTILGEGVERAALQRQAAELGISQSVQLPGVVQDPETWMARAGIFVLPSRFEGFPNALLEAMAMGCPTIAADCDSGPREIIRHGEDGMLVPPENASSLSEVLIRLMDDATLRDHLGRSAKRVRQRFSKDVILPRWQILIEEIAGKK